MPPTPTTPPQSQPVHTDADFEHPSHPFALVINVPLITMTPENGSTELWLGTHTDSGLHVQEGMHGERASGRIKPSLLEERKAVRPPYQPIVKKGSIVIRDLRLWHAGKGNHTQDPRVMLAMSKFYTFFGGNCILTISYSPFRAVVPKPHEVGVCRGHQADR